MSSRRVILIALTLALVAGVGVLRLTGEYGWAIWLIGGATVSGALLVAANPAMAASGRYLSLGRRDIPVLLAVAASFAICAWVAGAVTAGLMILAILLKIAWEEIWFRGLWLEGAGNNVWAAISGSALFCAMHVPQSPERAFSLLLLSGLYYAIRAGGVSIVALILLHAAVNAASSSGAHTAVVLATLGGLGVISFLSRNATAGFGWKNA